MSELNDQQKSAHKLLETVGGINAAMLEKSPAEHATILNSLKTLYEYRVAQEQTKAQEEAASARINKALAIDGSDSSRFLR